MKIKSIITVIFILFSLNVLNGNERAKRPCELQFFVNSHLNTKTMIDYNRDGDVIKMSSYENGKLVDYARYNYNIDGRLSYEKTYDSSSILIRTRYYFYDNSGLITGEKVFSSDEKLLEYLVIIYSNRKIQKIEYRKSDDILYQTIDFQYNNGILEAMAFNKIGKYAMVMKSVFDKDMLLIGHEIKHSNADVKIETKYIYEDGYARNETLQIIFR